LTGGSRKDSNDNKQGAQTRKESKVTFICMNIGIQSLYNTSREVMIILK